MRCDEEDFLDSVKTSQRLNLIRWLAKMSFQVLYD